MGFNKQKRYDVVIVGSNLFASHIAVQLAKTQLNILFVADGDIADSSNNFSVGICGFNKIKESAGFYATYSFSVIPTNFYCLQKTNFVYTISTNIKALVRKKNLSKKAFSSIEKKLNITNNISIKTNERFKINYSRLCVDTLKTAENKAVDIFTYANIKTISNKKIILKSGDEINAKLIINTDYNFINDDLKHKVQINEWQLFNLPKIALNINNPIKIKDEINIDIIPYFSEIFIKSDKNITISSIIKKIKNTIGVEVNKKIIIDERVVKNYSSNIIFDSNNNINIFESNYNLFKEKIKAILTEVSKILSINKLEYNTFNIYGSFKIQAEKYKFIRMVEEGYLQVQETGISPNEYTVLFYRYGSDLEKITEKAYNFYNDRKTRKNAWLYAELWYSVDYEFVKTAEDFIRRRTNFGLINQLDEEKKEIIITFIDKK